MTLCAVPVWADVETATGVNLTVTSLPEAKLALNQDFIFPLLRGDSPLTSGNNLKASLTGDITPVSMNGTLETVLTPAAFITITAGVTLGSGWNVPGLANGLGLNVRQADGTGKIEGRPFEGLVWKPYGGLTFQFDLAALVPGDWNHVVVQTYQEFNYRGNTRAGPEDSWLYEADSGENRNGWNYYASYVLGYQMPGSPVLKMLGFMGEMYRNLYNTPENRRDFGDTQGYWIVSTLFNFKITDWMDTTLILQMDTERNFKNYPQLSGILPEGDNLYYQDRILDTNNPLRLKFYRAGLLTSFKIR
jgi:hypothetical protein